MNNNKPKVSLKKAWLITWEWMGDTASVVDRVAGIIDYRKSQDRISDIVEFLYNFKTAYLSELAAYAKNRKNIPYKAEVDFNVNITCGHNPFLLARHVQNIKVFVDKQTNIETISWETFPTYKPTITGPEKVSDSREERFERIITGPLSFGSKGSVLDMRQN